jgi:LysM repeat protein
MSDHARRSPARLLAPLALLLAAAATLFVIAGSSTESDTADGSATSGRAAGRTTTTRTTTTTAPRRPRGNNYTVKTGDTLGSIAERTGVGVEQLLELNPDLDPQALVAGQKIKLRE